MSGEDFSAWHRVPDSAEWGHHIHSVPIGDPDEAAEIDRIAARLRADYENGDHGEFTYEWLAGEVYKILQEDRALRDQP